MSEKILPKAQVVRREDLTDDLMKMWFQPPPEFQRFKPGQYCTIGVDGSERPYSIASAPHQKLIELFLELVPEKYRTPASLTPKLWELHEGDYVSMRPKAKGAFQLDESVMWHGMIATVSGVAPFVSMLRARVNGYYDRLGPDRMRWYIFQGASNYDQFGYYDELMFFKKIDFLRYFPTVSQPREKQNQGWRGITGRVNTHYEYIREIIPQANSMIYLCGNEGMINDLGNTKATQEKPLGKFVGEYNIKKEVFF